MGQLTPAEAAKRQSIVDHGVDFLQGLWTPGAKPKLSPDTQEPAGANPDQPHVDRLAQIDGNLFKGTISGQICATYYSYNGWNYIGAKKGDRDVYDGTGAAGKYLLYKGYGFYRDDCSPNFNPEFGRADLKAATIKKTLERLAGNDDISKASRELLKVLRGQARRKGKVGQAIPYAWDAHHILPMEAFYKYLDQSHIDVIQRSTYDINTGQNMIFLPAQERSMKYHHLPAHVDNHPQYTLSLQAKFTDVKKQLQKAKSQLKPHQHPKFLADLLHTLEDEMFKAIAKIGPTKLL